MRKITLMLLMSLVSFCAYAQYPEGFEGTWTNAGTGLGSYAAGPAGWAIVNETGPISTWIQGNGSGQQPAYEGTKSAYLNADNVASGSVARDWLITPLTVVPTNGQLRFWSHLFVNGDSGNTYKVLIQPVTGTGSYADQTNTSLFTGTAANWTELQINPVQQDWTEKIVSLSTWVGQSVYIAFVMETDAGDRWAIDNVNVVSQCLDPSALTASNLGLTTATLSWTNNGGATNFDIEVLPVASTPTGVPTDTSTSATYNDTGLTENTDYKYYVRANCGNGNTSVWVGPFNFSTAAQGETCAAPITVTTLPYSTTNNTANFGDTVEGSPGATGCGTTSAYLGGNDVFYAYTPTTSGNISISVTGQAAWTGVFVYNSCANVGVSCVGGVASAATTPLNIATLAVTAGTTYYVVISTWPSPQTTPYSLIIQQVNCAPPVGSVVSTTSSSATLSWTNPSSATSWQIAVQGSGAGIPSGAGSTVTTNTNYVVTATTATPAVALAAATSYEYYVRADCGNGTFSAWAGPYPFMTTQVPASMPIAENWESAAGTNGWSLSNGTQTNKWVYGTATSNSPTHSVYVSNDNGVTNAYNTGATSVVHLYRDITIPAGADQALLQFDWKSVGENGWDYIRVWMLPTNVVPATGTQIVAGADRLWVTGANFQGSSTWQTSTNVIPVGAYAGQTRRLVFEWRNDGGGGTNPPGAVDNINFSVITCPSPTALTLGATTENQATFNWTAPTTAPASYDYYFSTTSTAPTASTTPTGNTTTTTNTQSGLLPSTAYYFWVRSHCSDSDTSFWVGPVSFTTPQIPATLPLNENWESAAGLNGWTLSNGTQTNKWAYGTATSNSPTHSLYVTNDNGVTNAYTNTASSVVHAYRDLSIPTGTTDVSLSFDWKNVGETGFDYVRVWLVPATWTPTVGTQITAAADRIWVGNLNFVGNANWTTYNNIQSWATYAGSIRRVVFEWRNDGIIGTNPAGAIDNINIVAITCPQPINLTATNIGQTSATLGWTNVGPATQWEYYITETPATAPTASTVGVITSDSTPDVTLESATQYSYWVRAVCGDTDKSFWSGPYTFNTTLCEVADQCNYTFTLTDSWGDGWNGNTMTVSQNGIPVATFGSTFTTGLGPVTITVPMCDGLPFQLYWNAGGNFANEVGVSVVNGFGQTLYTKPAGTGTQNSLLYTGEVDCLNPACLPPVGVTVTDETTTSISVTWTPSVVPGATYEVYYTNQGSAAPGETPATNVVPATTNSAVIEGLDPSTVYDIYVRTICSTTSNSLWTGPVTHETDPLCPEPIDMQVTCLSSTGASIAWTADGSETSWEVVVQAASAPIPTSGTVVTEPIYLAQPLTPNTAYTAYVRAICPDVDGFSSWAEVDFTTNVGPGDAAALCTSTTSVPSSTGAPGYGQIGCLFSTPNPIWYYFTVDYAGTTAAPMNFTLTQVNTAGTPIDVDFAAFGPFESALDACSQIDLTPSANNPLIVACSYSASATENFVIPNVQDGQVYALLITNFNGSAGNISLTQTNATTPGAPTTSCDPVVELGNNQTHCATDSIELTANVDNPGVGTEYEYVWTLDGYAYTPTVVETGDDYQTILVEEAGQHVIGVTVTVTDNPDEPTDEDTVTITLSPVFTAPTPAPVTLCGATGTADLDLSAIDFLGTLDPNDYQVDGVFTSNANAQSNTGAIYNGIYNTGSTTLYIRISDANVPGCFQIVPLVVTVNTTPSATITYADSPFCSDETTGTVTQTGSAGGTYTSTTGLVVDATTGAIDVAASEPGTYTVTYTIAASASCPEFTTSTVVTVVAAPEASIAYDDTPYCSNGGTAAVTFSGTVGGTYTSTAGLVIDAQTGEVDLAASTAGTYVVTYTIADTGDCAGTSVTANITITALPTATISYAASPYCSNAGVATVTFAGTGTGGVYTATDGLIIDATTGEINLAANGAGTYTVTYTIAAANGCQEVTATADVTITELPLAGFSYTYASVCQNAGAQQIQLAPGAAVGVFSADSAGLAIDAATGTVTPGDSQPGVYVVTNTIAAANGCGAVTETFTIEITPAPVPTFSYAAVAYCQDETTNPLPVLDGASGTFTATAGLVINAATGEVDLAQSTPGTYTVTNTVTGSDSCPTVTSTAEITITSLPVIALEQGCVDNLYSIWVNFDDDTIYSEDNVTIEWTKGGVYIANTAMVVLGGQNGPGAGTYDVTVTPNDGAVCPSVAQIVVESVNCFTPKGISPNGDTKNDTWDLTGFNVRKVEIFNRYGKEVYSFTGNYTDQFAGLASNGEKLPSGTYYYMFERTDGTTETGWVYVNWEE